MGVVQIVHLLNEIKRVYMIESDKVYNENYSLYVSSTLIQKEI